MTTTHPPLAAPPTPTSARRRIWPLILLAVLATIAVLVAVWDWNWFKGLVERRVEAATGRRLEIGGDFDVDPGLRTATLRGRDVRFANAPGAKDPHMFTADAVAVDVRVWPLLTRDLVLPAIRLQQPKLLLERGADDPGNWELDRRRKRWTVDYGDLLVDEGRLRWRDARFDTDLDLRAATIARGADDARAPLALEGKGTYRGFDFALDGRVESPLALRDRETPYRVQLNARAGATRATARGALRGVGRLRDFDLQLNLRGSDLAQLDPLFGIVLPPTPPYTLDGVLRRRGDVWHYDGITGRVGDSDLAGDTTLYLDRPRPRLEAKLHSTRLDFDDLAGLVGAPPSADPGETASPQQRREAAALAASRRVLPQRPYALSKLRRMDADVTLRATRVDARPLPIESMSGRLRLDDGVAVLDPLVLGVAGGRVDSRIKLDASVAPIAASADVSLRGLELPKLFPRAELTKGSAGRIAGRAVLAGRGNSIAKMLATSDGDVGLLMGRGRISNLLLELAGLDVAEALGFLLGKDRIIPLRCAHADFAVRDGVVRSRSFVFDTTDTVLHGEGSIDLGDESLDLVLRPRPKDRSLVSLRSPLQVDGSFKDPDIHPQAGPLALRTLAAAALYSIAPPAALLALVETGPGEDADCRRAGEAELPAKTQQARRGEDE